MSVADDIRVAQRGAVLQFEYRGKTFLTLSVATVTAIGASLEREVVSDVVEEAKDENAIAAAAVGAFAAAYGNLILKYTGQPRTYKKGGKFWGHFEKAARTAARMRLSHAEYLDALVLKYCEIRRGDTAVIPYPSQLHGESAEQFVAEVLARSSGVVHPAAKARKLATTNQKLRLEEDDQYQISKARLKHRKADEFDVEYIKARQTQVYGEPKKWVSRIADELKGKAAPDGGEQA